MVQECIRPKCLYQSKNRYRVEAPGNRGLEESDPSRQSNLAAPYLFQREPVMFSKALAAWAAATLP